MKNLRTISMACLATAFAVGGESPSMAISFGWSMECGRCSFEGGGSNGSGYVAGEIIAGSAGASAPSGGAFYRAGGAIRADYGSLGVAAASSVTNNGSGNPIVYAGTLIKTYYTDEFEVRSSSLLPGTAVMLGYTQVVHIAANAPVGGYPGAPLFPNIPTGLTYGGPYVLGNDLNFGVAVDGWSAGPSGRDYANVQMGDFSSGLAGTKVFTFYKLAHVGDTVTANVRFEAATYQYNPVTYSNGFAGAAMHGLGTATSYLNYGGQDITMTALSGHTYQVFSATPEPAQWAMLIGGFAVVGGVARRRRRMVANG